MRRWLYVWWVPLLGLALSTSGTMSAVALVEAGHGLASMPCIVTAVIAIGVAFIDIMPESWGHTRRMNIDPRPCGSCMCINTAHESTLRTLAAVTKDRDELREALVTLQLEPPPRTGRTP